jgi:hypothetical protein
VLDNARQTRLVSDGLTEYDEEPRKAQYRPYDKILVTDTFNARLGDLNDTVRPDPSGRGSNSTRNVAKLEGSDLNSVDPTTR